MSLHQRVNWWICVDNMFVLNQVSSRVYGHKKKITLMCWNYLWSSSDFRPHSSLWSGNAAHSQIHRSPDWSFITLKLWLGSLRILLQVYWRSDSWRHLVIPPGTTAPKIPLFIYQIKAPLLHLTIIDFPKMFYTPWESKAPQGRVLGNVVCHL